MATQKPVAKKTATKKAATKKAATKKAATKRARPKKGGETLNAYMKPLSPAVAARFQALADVVAKNAPGAVFRMAYGLPTWHQEENLVHLGAFPTHIGIYPGPEAIEAFAQELAAFETSKGTIRVPHDVNLPVELLTRLTRHRVERAVAQAFAPQRATNASPVPSSKTSRR